MEIVDTFEPMVEGLEQIEQKRRVTAMETRLLKTLDDESQKQHSAYQEPTPPEERVFREPREPREPREYNRDDRPSGGRPAKRYNDSGPEKREPREGGDRLTRGGPSRGGPRGGSRGFRGGRGTMLRGGRGGFNERGGRDDRRDERRVDDRRDDRDEREDRGERIERGGFRGGYRGGFRGGRGGYREAEDIDRP